MTRAGRITLLVVVSAVAALFFGPEAIAHGIAGRTDLPIPRWLFGWAAALVLVVSFVALAMLWPKPRLEAARRRRLVRIPAAVDPICAVIGVALFTVVVYAGLAGTQSAVANIAPRFIYIFFWVGLVVASVAFGDLFRLFNPWRAIARAVAWGIRRISPDGLPRPIAYPERLGRWPAVVGLFAFAWIELVLPSQDRTMPSTLSTLALVYAAVQFIGMSVYGIERWTQRGDGFSVYFGLFAALSIFERRESTLYLRPPLVGATSLKRLPGTAALLSVMIGATAFDGASEGELWRSVGPKLQEFFVARGAGLEVGLELAYTVGLLLMILLIAGIYRIGVYGIHTISRDRSMSDLSALFVHTLIPIAAAYVIAHYFSLLVFESQAASFLISDPLGDGSNYFGTADSTIDYSILSPSAIWYTQVAILVTGHISGLILAHDRALKVFADPKLAIRSQYWMLVVMVGFTSLGLWLLSASNQ
ncbi:MAG: fenitrothion hydrolase [Actinomycetota bacterium]